MKKIYLALLLIALIATTFYLKSLNFGFTNFDDDRLIVNNAHIKTLEPENIRYIFSHHIDTLYQPLVMLSWAIDHRLGGGRPFIYHLHNLILHLLNVALVCLITQSLFKNAYIALITALIFCLHPLNAESVAWSAERKNLMYSSFFLLGLWQYLAFLKTHTKSKYLLVLLFFSLSLMSKPLAVSFAPVLLIIDFATGRKFFNKTLILEKIPFFALSLVFGFIALQGPDTVASFAEPHDFTFAEQSIISGLAMLVPVMHFIFPFRLSAYYPMPQNLTPQTTVLIFSSSILLILILIFAIKKRKNLLAAGLLFYLANITMVSKVFGSQPGNNLTADHYTYLPMIGLAWIIAGTVVIMIRKNGWLKYTAIVLISIYTGLLTFLLPSRIGVWEHSIATWNDVLEKYPGNAWALENKGMAQHKSGQISDAMVSFSKVLEIDPDRFTTYYNIGNLYLESKKYYEAYRAYDKAIQIQPAFEKAYLNKGITLENMGYPAEALQCYNKAVSIFPGYCAAHFNRANLLVHLQRYNEAMRDLRFLQAELPGDKRVDGLIAICRRRATSQFSGIKHKP